MPEQRLKRKLWSLRDVEHVFNHIFTAFRHYKNFCTRPPATFFSHVFFKAITSREACSFIYYYSRVVHVHFTYIFNNLFKFFHSKLDEKLNFTVLNFRLACY